MSTMVLNEGDEVDPCLIFISPNYHHQITQGPIKELQKKKVWKTSLIIK